MFRKFWVQFKSSAGYGQKLQREGLDAKRGHYAPNKKTTVLPDQDLFQKTEISTNLTGLGGLTTQGVCKKTSVWGESAAGKNIKEEMNF